MKVTVRYIVGLLAASGLLWLYSCANQLALTGGPRDESPPLLDTSVSFANYQVRFEKQDIELVFNEFINLRNPARQIVISPPLNFPPRITGRGKKVSITFHEDEILKGNATYVINFGESIVDFTEGNILENFTFVFSTGDYIDSLKISGIVKDAYDSSPRKDVLVLLYESQRDSLVYLERPFYFAKTDENGAFEVRNIRSDTFQVAVLSDLNLNYLYDPSSEEIGFYDEPLILKDTLTSPLSLEIFREQMPLQYISHDLINPGRLKLLFNDIPSLSDISVLDTTNYFITRSTNPKEIDLWYQPTNLNQIQILVDNGYALDTLSIRINVRNLDPLPTEFEINVSSLMSPAGLHPGNDLELVFDRPFISVDPDLISAVDTFAQDTIYPIPFIDEYPTQEMRFPGPWGSGSKWSFMFEPGAITDFFGNKSDTLNLDVNIASENDFGSIRLTIVTSDTISPLIIEILNAQDRVVRSITTDKSGEYLIDRLAPGEYSVRIIVDTDGNGRWDPGNFLARRQSEDIFRLKLERIRDNWTLDSTIDMNELKESDFLNEIED